MWLETYLLDNNRPHQSKFDVNKASQPRKQVDLCFRETRWTEENLNKLYADLKGIYYCVRILDYEIH